MLSSSLYSDIIISGRNNIIIITTKSAEFFPLLRVGESIVHSIFNSQAGWQLTRALNSRLFLLLLLLFFFNSTASKFNANLGTFAIINFLPVTSVQVHYEEYSCLLTSKYIFRNVWACVCRRNIVILISERQRNARLNWKIYEKQQLQLLVVFPLPKIYERLNHKKCILIFLLPLNSVYH